MQVSLHRTLGDNAQISNGVGGHKRAKVVHEKRDFIFQLNDVCFMFPMAVARTAAQECLGGRTDVRDGDDGGILNICGRVHGVPRYLLVVMFNFETHTLSAKGRTTEPWPGISL